MLHRVFIADDNPSVRSEIRAQLESSGFAVCGEAFDGLNALEQAMRELRPLAPLNWSPVENLHITSKFIGEWPEASLASFPPA